MKRLTQQSYFQRISLSWTPRNMWGHLTDILFHIVIFVYAAENTENYIINYKIFYVIVWDERKMEILLLNIVMCSQSVASLLTRQYWVLSNRSAIRHVTLKCVCSMLLVYYFMLRILVLSWLIFRPSACDQQDHSLIMSA